jgi:hypothetical protein
MSRLNQVQFKASHIFSNIYSVLLSTPGVHIKWGHCHHGMARPRVPDKEDGLQIWRVAVNIKRYTTSATYKFKKKTMIHLGGNYYTTFPLSLEYPEN